MSVYVCVGYVCVGCVCVCLLRLFFFHLSLSFSLSKWCVTIWLPVHSNEWVGERWFNAVSANEAIFTAIILMKDHFMRAAKIAWIPDFPYVSDQRLYLKLIFFYSQFYVLPRTSRWIRCPGMLCLMTAAWWRPRARRCWTAASRRWTASPTRAVPAHVTDGRCLRPRYRGSPNGPCPYIGGLTPAPPSVVSSLARSPRYNQNNTL